MSMMTAPRETPRPKAIAASLLAWVLSACAAGGAPESSTPSGVTPAEDAGIVDTSPEQAGPASPGQAGSAPGPGPVAPSMPSEATGTTEPDLASDLAITEVALYQGPKVQLMSDGAAVNASTPVVMGRRGILRVFVAPLAGYAPRAVVARLTLGDGRAFEVQGTVRTSSEEANLDSTFNFTLNGDELEADASFAVSLHETSGAPDGDTSRARYPLSGTANFGAEDPGGPLRIVIVPVQYQAGGGITPPVSADLQETLRLMMYRVYPAAEIEISVRAAPFVYDGTLLADGSGYTDMLNALAVQRLNDGVDTSVYYYGLFTPQSSFSSFCADGCIAGLSGLSSNAADDIQRVSIGLGYGEPNIASTLNTFVHEIGHAHGRFHAPCAAGAPDPNYPYAEGQTGEWGYDSVTETLYAPWEARDFMGYCAPIFVSDYGYRHLFARIRTVHSLANAYVQPPSEQPEAWQLIAIDADGDGGRGRAFRPRGPISGTLREVRVWAEDGRSADVEGRFVPTSHLPGGSLRIADPGFPVVRTRFL